MKDSGDRPSWRRWVIAAAVGLLIAFLIMVLKGGFRAADPADFWGSLSDAFFVPGALLAGVGILIWVSDQGEFDMLRYGVKKAFTIVLSEERRSRQPKTFHDYRTKRQEREPASFSYLLILGAVMILAGIVFVAISGQFEILPPGDPAGLAQTATDLP